MSAYSIQDIEEAFACAEARGNAKKLLYVLKDRVIAHLDGKCHCELRRCSKCKVRTRNGITFHKEDCPMRVRS